MAADDFTDFIPDLIWYRKYWTWILLRKFGDTPLDH
jgi:hypothetical protein